MGGHPYAGLLLKEVRLPQGLYPAVMLRGEDVYTPHGTLALEEGDSMLLGTVSTHNEEEHSCGTGKVPRDTVIEKERTQHGNFSGRRYKIFRNSDGAETDTTGA